uniref:DNA damage-inducible transcript 3 protein n=1 Tax=Pogona vitticeps TaxID=103695 RepID=A0A6J0SH92_9SAUR
MMAEPLPFSVGSPVPTWELEAWYEDLEEVLSLDVSSRTDLPAVEGPELEEPSLDDTALLWNLDVSDPLGASGSGAAENCDLSPHLTADLLELLGEEPVGGPPDSDSSRSSPPQTGTDDDEVLTGQKRKRSGQPQGSKRRRGREREQQNERRVAELTAQNEHLQREIERLSAEVEATRAALIQRMVNLKS